MLGGQSAINSFQLLSIFWKFSQSADFFFLSSSCVFPPLNSFVFLGFLISNVVLINFLFYFDNYHGLCSQFFLFPFSSPSLSRFVSAMSHYRPLLSSLITLCINSPVLHPSLCFSISLPSCTPMLHFMDYVFQTFCLSRHMLCELEGHSKQSVQCLALRLLLFVVQEST